MDLVREYLRFVDSASECEAMSRDRQNVYMRIRAGGGLDSPVSGFLKLAEAKRSTVWGRST